MSVTAKDVKSLRDSTGAGMMDCKRSLTDADGNVEAFCHALKPVAAVMWHPERDAEMDGDKRVRGGVSKKLGT